ncbi:MAG: glycosyltransferase [Dehalococcoidia bacterium]|nr:glycosyltransferase [Dehalococcoidia bacterium]
MTGRRVSVVIPVKDDWRIAACVASIRRGRPDWLDVQVIVVDNGSGDEFRRGLAGDVPGYDVLLCEPEAGVYRARNRGVQASDGEVIFFTDSDCLVRPGWFETGLALIDEGYDLVQGFSGSVATDRVARLLQARYGKRYRKLRRGDPLEVDTRNLAVRRTVFEHLSFNERFRRVGDTEFGLRAELLGYRVGYGPGMRVDHDHDEDLRVFAAKQVCHGWGAQRLMCEERAVRWHGGHLQLVHRATTFIEQLPGRQAAARALAGTAVFAAGLLQRAPRLPWAAGYGALTVIDKAALLAGHLMYAEGQPEPSPSELLGRRLLRD